MREDKLGVIQLPNKAVFDELHFFAEQSFLFDVSIK